MIVKLRLMLLLVILLWAAILVMLVMQRLGGTIFPVTSTLTITSVTPYENRPGGWSVVSGRFAKLRDCEFQGIQWFYVQPDASVGEVAVITYFEDKPQVRDRGEHSFNRLIIRIATEHEIRNFSRGEVIHDCYDGWLWKTITPFY